MITYGRTASSALMLRLDFVEIVESARFRFDNNSSAASSCILGFDRREDEVAAVVAASTFSLSRDTAVYKKYKKINNTLVTIDLLASGRNSLLYNKTKRQIEIEVIE